ncbi:MAG: GGDEF domain-containing protein [Candidatus Pacearchaeota archaeon]
MNLKEKLKVLDPKVKSNLSIILRQLESNIDLLYELATIDEKTGVYNNKFFKTISEMELDKAKREIGPLSLMILDLDNFKKLNDTYGHLIGDEILKRLALVLKNNIRKYDIISRFGGEEFVILLPNTQIKRAKLVCERIRREVQNDRELKKYSVTFSGGLTEYKKGDSVKKMQLRADKAVYQAKKKGKNRIELL